MAGEGGEAIRAVFEAAKEEAAQAAENAGQAIAKFTNETTQNVLDSVQAIESADGASADAARGIRGNAGDVPGENGGGGPGGQGNVSKLLNGEDPRLKPGTPEYERYAEELAQDPAHGGQVGAKSMREAVVGIRAEADGDLPGPLIRAQFEQGRDVGEFTDATGQHWDVKSSPDVQPDYGRSPGRPIPAPQSDVKVTKMISTELGKGINVLLDPHGMTPARLAHLQELVASHPEWGGKVIWGK